MSWKEVQNNESQSKSITYSGDCILHKKQADVTSFFSGILECRTDLQKTYRYSGYKCSLQENGAFTDLKCEECPLIQKEYL